MSISGLQNSRATMRIAYNTKIVALPKTIKRNSIIIARSWVHGLLTFFKATLLSFVINIFTSIQKYAV